MASDENSLCSHFEMSLGSKPLLWSMQIEGSVDGNLLEWPSLVEGASYALVLRSPMMFLAKSSFVAEGKGRARDKGYIR